MQYYESDDLKFMGEPRELAPTQYSAFVEPALLEALGRILGYTDKQLAATGDILSRFTWRSPLQYDRSRERTPTEGSDSKPRRNWAA